MDATLNLPGHPRESEEEQSKLGTFRYLSRRNQQKKPPIMPGGFRKVFPEAQPPNQEYPRRTRMHLVALTGLSGSLKFANWKFSRRSLCLIPLTSVVSRDVDLGIIHLADLWLFFGSLVL